METKDKKTKKILLILAIPALVFVLCLVFVVINKTSHNPVTKNATQIQKTTDPNKVEIEGQLISTFPKFPIFPGAKILSSTKIGQADTRGFEAKWQTDKPVPEVMGWYLNSLQSEGWQVVTPPGDLKTAGEQIAKVSKGKISATIGIDQESKNKTEISVNIPE